MDTNTQQKWFVTGASGFIGRRFVAQLCAAGHRVCGLSRQQSQKLASLGLKDVTWVQNITDCPFAPTHILNLAGEPIADQRWSDTRIQVLRQSRIDVTKNLSAWLQQQNITPELIIQGSAIGYYGTSTPAKTETSPQGHGFSATLCHDWEQALAAPENTRVVLLRIGVVIGAGGGMLKKLLPIFKIGMGGKIGDGHQMLSWVSLHDLLRLIDFAVENPAIQGVLNATAPNPINNKRFAQHLAKAVHRPALMPTPAFIMRGVFGKLADELLLNGQAVLPQKAMQNGFQFDHPWICRGINAALNPE